MTMPPSLYEGEIILLLLEIALNAVKYLLDKVC